MRSKITRRDALIGAGATGLALSLPPIGAADVRMHNIPSSGEALPPVGLGTSRVFNSVSGEDQRAALVEVLEALFCRWRCQTA